jgi:hypothetical protein
MTFHPSGSSPWTGEEAICGFWLHHHHFSLNSWTWSDELQSLADNVVGKLADHWSDLGPLLGGAYKLTQVKAAQIGTDGKEIDAKTSSPEDGTANGSGGSILPPEVAVCVSMLGYVPGTFVSHPGRRRSRMYWPYIPASTVSSGGKINNPTLWEASFTDFFNDIQGMHGGAGPAPGNPSEYWELVTVSGIDGSVTQVERIGVDDKYDSQRRRQHQTPPAWTYGTISHS